MRGHKTRIAFFVVDGDFFMVLLVPSSQKFGTSRPERCCPAALELQDGSSSGNVVLVGGFPDSNVFTSAALLRAPPMGRRILALQFSMPSHLADAMPRAS